jgi:hypothetical protein
MANGISRRRWLLGFLTALGGSWLARHWPAVSAPPAPRTPWPAPAAPRLPTCDSLGHVATYVYDGATCLVLRPTSGTALVTTVVYDSGQDGKWGRF